MLKQIIEQAEKIDEFATYPVIAQISMLYDLIYKAKADRVPDLKIVAALNQAGSTVKPARFRNAWSKVKKIKSEEGHTVVSISEVNSGEAKKDPVFSRPQIANSLPVEKLTSAEKRQRKADEYVNPKTSNRILKSFLQEGEKNADRDD
jgi:hypothetical protein